MFGLIGKKLGHSFSAFFFNDKFKREGIDESYHLFPLKHIEDLPDLLAGHSDLKGLNVTIPYKQEVIRFLDSISDEAQKIGAVNVIKIENDNKGKKLCGFNTDYIGFEESLKPLLHQGVKKALILGTGGASKSVAYVLSKLNIEGKFVSRHPSDEELSYMDLDEKIIRENLLIVNTTPLGMYPNIEGCPDIPYKGITPEHICYDLIYNPGETLFMKKCKEQGATVKNGMEMLEFQAKAAWHIWNE